MWARTLWLQGAPPAEVLGPMGSVRPREAPIGAPPEGRGKGYFPPLGAEGPPPGAGPPKRDSRCPRGPGPKPGIPTPGAPPKRPPPPDGLAAAPVVVGLLLLLLSCWAPPPKTNTPGAPGPLGIAREPPKIEDVAERGPREGPPALSPKPLKGVLAGGPSVSVLPRFPPPRWEPPSPPLGAPPPKGAPPKREPPDDGAAAARD